MSLIHWWPLNGDTQDYIGLKHGTLVGGGNVSANGKIGLCYSSTNNSASVASSIDGIAIPGGSLIGEISNEYSFACWVKVHGNHGQYQSCIMSSGDWNLNNCWVLGFNQTNTEICCPVDGYNTGKISITKLTNDKWYHLTTVYQNGITTAYLDGIKVGSVERTGIYRSYSSDAYIGRDQGHNGFFPFNGDINDLRIYDHALSLAEIQELKKALVIHYTFDDVLAESTNNLITGLRSGGRTTYDSTNSTITTTGENKDTYFYLLTSEPIIEGLTYTLSCQGENIGDGKQFIFGMQGQTTAHHQFTITEGYNEFTFIANNYINGLTTILMDDMSRTGWENKAIFSQFQLEKKDHATPYTPSNRTGMLYNETGLIQANESSSIELSRESAIGAHSLSNGANKYFNIPVVGDISAGATASLWVKVKSYPTANAVVFADANSLLAFGFYGTQNAIISCKTSKPYISNIKSKWKTKQDGTPEWNHVVVQRLADSKIECYLNGVKLSPSTSTTNWTHYKNCTIGCRYNDNTYKTNCECYIDDFRLYHSLLTTNEIKELYNCGGRISNLGDALTGSFIEGETATKVNKNHTITTKELYEQILPDGYQQLEYIQSNSNQYINTGVIPTNQTEIQYDHQYIGESSGWHALFGMDNHSSNAGMGFTVFIVDNEYRPYMGTDWGISTHSYTSYGRELLILNQQGLSINNTKIYNQFAPGTHTALSDVKLFAYWRPTGGTNSGSKVRLYNCKFLENGVLIRNFIPARNSAGVLGLYDIVNNQFYTNAGSGEFIAGPTITTGQASMLRVGGLTVREIIEI